MSDHLIEVKPGKGGRGVEELLQTFERLKSERGNWDNQWQEAAKYCLPHRADINTEKASGDKVATDVYDATARLSAQKLASILHSFLTNPASQWFAIRTQDEMLMERSDVREWLSEVQKRIYNALNSSNFANQVHEHYLDLVVYGTGCLFEEEDPVEMIRFKELTPREVYLVENSKSQIDEVFIFQKLTARQAYGRWGKGLPEDIQKTYEKKPEEKFDFLQVIGPRHERNVGKKDSVNMPYFSIHVAVKDRRVLSEGGYEEFPCFAPRFSKQPGEKYGYSPTLVSLPDIKMLNAMAKTLIKGAQKVVDPPLQLPHDGFLLPLKTIPGGINYRTSGQANDKIEPLMTNAQIPIGIELINAVRSQIQAAYFMDVLLTVENRENMTATEVLERRQEKLLLLGPVLGRLMNEMLDPLIERSFSIMSRRGALPPPPMILLERDDYIIQYVSPLASAQRFTEAQAITNFLTIVSGIAQSVPDVLDKINTDRTVDTLAEIYGVPPDLVYDEQEIEEVRAAKAQAQQQASQMQNLGALLQAAKLGSEADKNVAEAEKKRKEGKASPRGAGGNGRL